MTDPNLMPVRLEVVKELIVEKILGEALARYPGTPRPAVEAALTAAVEHPDLPACDGGVLDLRMRRVGYLCRVAERSMFDPAQNELPGLADRMATSHAGDDWAAAAAAISVELAAAEPLERPRPDDDGAVSWKVPGPGGHVRHYVVSAAIADALEFARSQPDGGEPAEASDELKRAWTYGFLLRCCEEATPPPAA
jgi:hypothetical protein